MNAIERYISHRTKATEVALTKTLTSDRWKQVCTLDTFPETLEEWAKATRGYDAHHLLVFAAEELRAALEAVCEARYGQFRFGLRLAMECIFRAVYFSGDALRYQLWKSHGQDVSWTTLIDEDIGLLSKRYSMAFCPSLKDVTLQFRSTATKLYRELSEHMHGNAAVSLQQQKAGNFSEEHFSECCEAAHTLETVGTFLLVQRFCGSTQFKLSQKLKESINDVVGTVQEIREMIG